MMPKRKVPFNVDSFWIGVKDLKCGKKIAGAIVFLEKAMRKDPANVKMITCQVYLLHKFDMAVAANSNLRRLLMCKRNEKKIGQEKVGPCPANKTCMVDCKICKTGEQIRERVSANSDAGIIPEHIRNGNFPVDVARL